MQEAVDAAKEAFKTWSQTTVMARQQYMLKYQQLIKDNMVTGHTKWLSQKENLWNKKLNRSLCYTEKAVREHHAGTGQDAGRCGRRRFSRITSGRVRLFGAESSDG